MHSVIKHVRIFVGFHCRRGVKQLQHGAIKNLVFGTFGPYVFGTLGSEANIRPIILYYLVPCRLSTDPQIRDFEWPFYVQFSVFTITNRVSAIRTYLS